MNNQLYKISILFFLLYFLVCEAGAYNAGILDYLPSSPGKSVKIAESAGNSVQANPQVVRDALGGQIVVWEDRRSGASDIYAQRIDENGKKMWKEGGLPICIASNNQLSPRVVADSLGGAIIAWQDFRDGNYDIYAQKISYAGEIRWDRDGVLICDDKHSQFDPQLCSDGADGAFIVFYDNRNNNGEDIFAQRISYRGYVLWDSRGIMVAGGKGSQWHQKVCADENGAAVIVWEDARNGDNNTDVIIQKISAGGEKMWGEEGTIVCGAAGNQLNPEISRSTSGKYLIAWQDFRSMSPNIYCQMIDDNSIRAWDESGVIIESSAYIQENQRVFAIDKGFYIVWQDYNNGQANIKIQMILTQGTKPWGPTGKSVADIANVAEAFQAALAANDGIVIGWHGAEKGASIYRAQMYTKNGVKLWDAGGMDISVVDAGLKNLQISSFGENRLLAVWQDKRGGNYDIFGQALSLVDGKKLWRSEGVIINNSHGVTAQQNAKIAGDGSGSYLIVWEDYRSGQADIFMQKMDSSGRINWGKSGLAVCDLPKSQCAPEIIYDGKSAALIAYEDNSLGRSRIMLQKVDFNGKKIWGDDGIEVAESKLNQSIARITADGGGGAILVWREVYNIKNSYIYIQKINAQGKKMWGEKGKMVCSVSGGQDNPKIIISGSAEAVVCWEDFRDGRNNSDIYAQKFDAQGNPMWAAGGAGICRAPDIQSDPRLISDGNGGAIIAWIDKGNGKEDVYAQKINAGGTVVWRKDGIPVCQAGGMQKNVSMVSDGSGGAIVAFADYQNGNWDIIAQKISPAGGLLFGSKGILACAAAETQFSPLALADSNYFYIIWEDYRNQSHYQVFAQKISSSGKALWQKDGVVVAGTSHGAMNPQMAIDKKNKAVFIVWEDYRGGEKSIYSAKIPL